MMSDPNRPARPKVIVTRKLVDAVEARMAELFDVELNPDDEPMSRAAPSRRRGRTCSCRPSPTRSTPR
jgi:glyoxylate reductase